MSEVIWSPSALKQLTRLDATIQQRVRAAVLRFAEIGTGDVRKYIEGAPGELSLRVGEWRVFLVHDRPARRVNVLRVSPRGGAYR